MKTREYKRMVKLDFFFPSKIALFGYIIYIYIYNHHIHFWVQGHSLWSTFSLPLLQGPKTKKSDHENWTIKLDHESWTIKSNHEKRSSIFHGPTSWSMVSTGP